MGPYVRPFLEVRQTTLRDTQTNERYKFNGLFTTRKINAGDFIGFYNGIFHKGGYNGRDFAYVFESKGGDFRPPRDKDGVIDPHRYPLAMINEPPGHKSSNVRTTVFTRADNVIPLLPPKTKISAVGFHACRTIERGEELFFNYGSGYDRSQYSVPLDKRKRIVGPECFNESLQPPSEMARWCGLLWVSPECYHIL